MFNLHVVDEYPSVGMGHDWSDCDRLDTRTCINCGMIIGYYSGGWHEISKDAWTGHIDIDIVSCNEYKMNEALG